MAQLNLPCDEAAIRALRVGEPALLSGRIITGRDTAHHWLVGGFREEVAPYLAGSIIYHCGPVMRKNPDGSYDFVAARPRTSAREEPYQADVIARYGVRGVIGKGGMFDKTRKGLVEHRAVYLHAVGGTAQSLARRGPRRAHVQAGRIRRARGHVGDLSEGLPDGGHHGRARRVAARDHRRGLLGLKAG